MASDAADRIREAVEARMERARAATPGPWRAEQGDPECLVVHHGNDVSSAATGVVMLIGSARSVNAVFIAAESPDVVLANCAEDLRTWDSHRPDSDGHCVREWRDSDGWLEPWPCDDIRSLARRYGIEAP